MIEQIKRSIKNGFNFRDITKVKSIALSDVFMWGDYDTMDINPYHLIFGTDFLDSLVDNGKLSKMCCNCSHAKHYEPSFNLIKCKFHSLQRSDNDCGNFEQIIKSANYHRQQLATMTLDEMIEYISKL